jgi:VacB/RNase II family 3'-5' exoribonuclease
MKVDEEAQQALAAGFAAIAEQYKLPADFPLAVNEEASAAVAAEDSTRRPRWLANRRDLTSVNFMTLDPASSTDLDQAFALDVDGDQIVLSYALADVGAFVQEGGAIEAEAWQRGVTIYGLAEKTPLYPKVISQGAASLLPDGPRPAIVVTVAIASNGTVALRSIERATVSSRAKLAYETVDITTIPNLQDFAKRMWTDEVTRGAVRIDFPQQEVVVDSSAPGGVRLDFRARVDSEVVNSALSLAVNLAVADLMSDAKVGVFRVMDDPEPRALAMLRRVAHALGIKWSAAESLRDLQKRMDPNNSVHQKFLLDAQRSGGRASYAVYSDEKRPWHSAIAATYAHATAPMRRLADRYVLDLAFHLANHETVPPALLTKLDKLPEVMERGEGRGASVERAVIDLLEAVSLQNRIGDILEAEVVDAKGDIVQVSDPAIRARAAGASTVGEGQLVRVRIDLADPITRKVRLTIVS